MENTENIKSYTFIELLPILLAFSQSMRLCDRALEDKRLIAVHEDAAEAVGEVRARISSLIDLLSSEAIFD